MHAKKIAHRDLKPENLLLVNETTHELKVADFGFAAPVKKGLKEKLGTPLFVSPEVLLGQKYGTKVDIWALGVMTYIFLSGQSPFLKTTTQKLY